MCCTSVLSWLVMILECEHPPILDEETMTSLLSFANQLHKKIQVKQIQRQMLNLEELFAFVNCPIDMSLIFFHGHNQNSDSKDLPEISNLIAFSDLEDKLSSKTGYLLTCNNHTIGLYCDEQQNVFFFDSMPACILKLSRGGLCAQLEKTFGEIMEFNLCSVNLL